MRSRLKKIFSKIDSLNFYRDLDRLFKKYHTIYKWGISVIPKAELKSRELISYERLDLGLDSIFSLISLLNKEEQEIVAASEIITNTSIGLLDSIQLNTYRNLYKEKFPNSMYNQSLTNLKSLTKKRVYPGSIYNRKWIS
ncbi:MAG: hypothetical protein LUF85_11560 [Bacteroides sp.]|nr:hypothetical protein [Bacteroides sp.]